MESSMPLVSVQILDCCLAPCVLARRWSQDIGPSGFLGPTSLWGRSLCYEKIVWHGAETFFRGSNQPPAACTSVSSVMPLKHTVLDSFLLAIARACCEIKARLAGSASAVLITTWSHF